MEVREIIERRHQINVYLVHGKPRIYLTWLKSEIKKNCGFLNIDNSPDDYLKYTNSRTIIKIIQNSLKISKMVDIIDINIKTNHC
jgi:hypothetical protein